MKKTNLTLFLTLIAFLSTSILSVDQSVDGTVEGMPMISGVGEGTLSCVDGTTYEDAALSFRTNNGVADTELGRLQIEWQNEVINGVLDEFGTTFGGDEFKLRYEFQSDICGGIDLIYLGNIAGNCGEDVTINLNDGYYLSGDFRGRVVCLVTQVPPSMDERQVPPSMDERQVPPSMDKTVDETVGKASEADQLDETRDTLQDLVKNYREKNYDEAAALAIRLTQLNLDFVNDRLLSDTESSGDIDSLREDLRRSVTERAPLPLVQQLINTINKDLDSAEELLETRN